ncbi:aminoglycoside phosphotransferase family protein [Streptomyces sp. NPDC096132]|uniref:aminoglycoside phosphotransferase family protein n=1 Tax=Streptomyces sp. NPDC096132 TaxID=3366075 RepID=UPI0038132B9C
MVRKVIDIPGALVTEQVKINGEAGRAFVAGLPDLVAEFLDRWDLRIDGPSLHGMCALVLPVVTTTDRTRAVLKLQLLDEETVGEPIALRLWDGHHAVRLLRHDSRTGTMLLERLDPTRTLSHIDVHEAVPVIAHLLERLTSIPAPPAIRRLDDIARSMLERTPRALDRVPDPRDRRLLTDCASALREVSATPGDRLLHWDLHYDNVLAADHTPWLAIDPKPLAGTPAFELWPALRNRFDPADVLWRFDAMTEVLNLDRENARAWTLARLLQNTLWNLEDDNPPSPTDLETGRRLRDR